MGRENRRLALFGKACVIALHPVRRVLHHGFTGMRVDIERERRGCVSHERLHRLDVRAGRDRNCRAGVPLRYNYDKPEKPRISRVFGYLARFFILFQTEKSSREVVIS